MAHTVSFGVIEKKVNSTKQTYTEAFSASCVLKEQTDVLHPTLSIQAQISGDAIIPCNYMYIADFGNRYYWIDSINFFHGVWYVSGSCDVLATYKTNIGNMTPIIVRSTDGTINDLHMIDTRFPLENIPSLHRESKAMGIWDSDGTIILTVVGNDGSDSQCFWATDPQTWAKLYSIMYTSNFLNDTKTFWNNITTDIYNMIIDPGQYIIGAVWIPCKYSTIAGAYEHIWIGTTECVGFYGIRVLPSSVLWSDTVLIDIPEHPQQGTIGEWIRGNCASRDVLILPGYGKINLDSDILAEKHSGQIGVSPFVDCAGTLTYYVYVASGGQFHDVGYFNANIGVPVGVADLKPEVQNAITSSIGAIASGSTGNAAGFLRGLAGAISASMSFAPKVDVISTGGSRALTSIQNYVCLDTVFYTVQQASPNYEFMGRPSYYSKKISTMTSGTFIICDAGTVVKCSGTKAEMEEVDQYLTEGFYYE